MERPIPRALAAAALLTSTGLAFSAAPGGAMGAGPASVTYECGDLGEEFVVPTGITEIDVVATGGAGGSGWNETLNEANPQPTPGGLGGRVTGTLTVTPGESLFVFVGCAGNSEPHDDDGVSPGGQGGDPGGDGGWGGDNGTGGGGGGSSDIRRGHDAPDAVIMVAAGGGGSGGVSEAPQGVGGHGGGVTGGDGADGDPDTAGLGATATEGGHGWESGTNSKGGDGADGSYGAGGGGGGGLYGGGGGGEDGVLGGGGGGGSSFVDPAFVDATNTAGVQAGNGSVTISFGDSAPSTQVPPTTEGATPTTEGSARPAARPATPVAARPTFTG